MELPSMLVSILAGGIAGTSETLITYPTEFVKTCRQLPQSSQHRLSSIEIIRSTIRTSGVSGLYSGCGVLAFSNFCKGGVRFVSFEQSKAFLQARLGASPWVNVGAGLFAGVTESVLVVTPGESLKTRIIHDKSSGAGKLARLHPLGVAALVVKSHGVLALWSGLIPVLCKQGTNSAVRFGAFGWIQDQISRVWPDSRGEFSSTLAAGACSGIITTYASMPFDNIKTRMQSLGPNRQGMFRLALSMLSTEGPLVFWRATTPRLVRLTMSSAVTFTVFNQIVDLAARSRAEVVSDQTRPLI